MPQDYKVTSVKPTGFTDQNGNDGYNVWFEGVPESALMLAKKAPVEGGVEHGEIKDLPTKKNPAETYKRFTRVQREDNPTTDQIRANDPLTPSSKYFDGRQDSIERQCALKAAVEIGRFEVKSDLGNTSVDLNATLNIANQFVSWIKDGTMPGDNTSGYEAAKATAERLKNPWSAEEIVESIEEVFGIASSDPGPSDEDYQEGL